MSGEDVFARAKADIAGQSDPGGQGGTVALLQRVSGQR